MEDEILANRLMAACARDEIWDALEGKGGVELAKKSLYLLCSMIADANPLNSQNAKVKKIPSPNTTNGKIKPCNNEGCSLWRKPGIVESQCFNFRGNDHLKCLFYSA